MSMQGFEISETGIAFSSAKLSGWLIRINETLSSALETGPPLCRRFERGWAIMLLW